MAGIIYPRYQRLRSKGLGVGIPEVSNGTPASLLDLPRTQSALETSRTNPFYFQTNPI